MERCKKEWVGNPGHIQNKEKPRIKTVHVISAFYVGTFY